MPASFATPTAATTTTTAATSRNPARIRGQIRPSDRRVQNHKVTVSSNVHTFIRPSLPRATRVVNTAAIAAVAAAAAASAMRVATVTVEQPADGSKVKALVGVVDIARVRWERRQIKVNIVVERTRPGATAAVAATTTITTATATSCGSCTRVASR